MLNLRPVLYVVGLLLLALGVAMALPAAADAYVGSDDATAFVAGGLIALALGALAGAANRGGPGLGDAVGPVGAFAPLPDAAKWLLSAGMLLGRLELFTVFALFTRRFWRD